MAQNKTLVASKGARLERIEDLAAKQKGKITFKLSTYRPPLPRYIADEVEAEEAFAREFTASMEDPGSWG